MPTQRSTWPYGVNSLVSHTMAPPSFLPDGRFWYRDTGADGVAYVMVDPAKGTKTPAFDQVKLAGALNVAMAKVPVPDGMASARTITADRLPITDFTPGEGQSFNVSLGGAVRMHCDMAGAGVCTQIAGSGQSGGGRGGRGRGGAAELSPDKKKQAFIRDWNLWVRDVKSGEETQLTTDGVKNYGYATDNAGWTHSNNAILVWSPDSTKIATFQQDQRKTGDMYLVSTNNGHPKLEAWKYPLAGDKDVTMIERVVIDVNAKKVVRFKMAPDQHRSTLCDDISCRGGSGWDDVMWADDGKTIAFVSTSRDHKTEWLRVANPETGDVREVYTETVPKFFESGNGKVNWKYLSATHEFLWFSETSGWGQMYLYDMATGKMKNQITTGEGNVTQVLRVDEKARVLYFKAVGKEKGWDPYYSAYYRVDFDGKNMKLLTPERADHQITPSPDGKFFVDTYSTVTEPQTSVVRDVTGRLSVQLGRQDIGRLVASGWVPPTPITVKGRDGKTDIAATGHARSGGINPEQADSVPVAFVAGDARRHQQLVGRIAVQCQALGARQAPQIAVAFGSSLDVVQTVSRLPLDLGIGVDVVARGDRRHPCRTLLVSGKVPYECATYDHGREVRFDDEGPAKRRHDQGRFD